MARQSGYMQWLGTGMCVICVLAIVFLLIDTHVEEDNETLDVQCKKYHKERLHRNDDNYGRAHQHQGRYLDRGRADAILARPHWNNISEHFCFGESIKCKRKLSAWTWAWAQFVTHDIVESSSMQKYDPDEYDKHDARNALNYVSSFLDGSSVYGPNGGDMSLRTRERGRMRTSIVEQVRGTLLPLDDTNTYYVTGDSRSSENLALEAIHTLMVREHNYWAEKIYEDGELDDNAIFAGARRHVVSEIQAITYEEFLPALLGKKWRNHKDPIERVDRLYDSDDDDSGDDICYDPKIDPRVYLEFSAAAFRILHTMVNDQYYIVNTETGHRCEEITLSDAYYQGGPQGYFWTHDIDSLLLGLSMQTCEEVDPVVVDSLRLHLFPERGGYGYRDLAAIDVHRGRHEELPCYETTRRYFGTRHAEMSEHCESLLERVYVPRGENVDLWIGLVCEKHEEGSSVGHTANRIIGDQFRRLREGDPSFYEFNVQDHRKFKHTRLVELLRRNTHIRSEHLREHQFFNNL